MLDTRREPLDDRPVVVITGIGRGLGRALCDAFAQSGFLVAGMARKAQETHSCDTFDVVDVTDDDAVDRFTARVAGEHGRIDAWLNNAAVADVFPVRDGSAARWARTLGVNVLGVAAGTRAFARHVADRPGPGVLVNLTAGSAAAARAGWGCYAASKAAVERLTEAVAAEEAAAGLRAFCVSPGPMDTDMNRAVRELPLEVFPGVEEFARALPGVLADPAGVARHVAALVTEQLRPGAEPPPRVAVVPRPLPAAGHDRPAGRPGRDPS